MAFKERTFNEPTYQDEQIEENSLILISCEGKVTEPEYFEALKRKLGKKIGSIIHVDVIPNLGPGANPQDVLSNLENHIHDVYQFREQFDSLWLVIDREKVEDRKNHLLAIHPECEDKGYRIALSNPTFELWLLMHVAKLNDYCEDALFENAWVTPAKNKRFMEKQLSEILGGYSKKSGQFPVKILNNQNLTNAIKQHPQLNKPFEILLDELGTNVGEIVTELIE